MLSALLAQLGTILDTQFEFTSETKESIISFLGHYKSGQWIYPGVLKRELGISIENIYRLLSKLEKDGYLESWYEYCCGHCQKVLGMVKRFNELPETFECEVCGREMPTIENTIKIYKVC